MLEAENSRHSLMARLIRHGWNVRRERQTRRSRCLFWGTTLCAFSPGRGFPPEDYPYARTKVVPLDEKRMIAQFADGIEIPIRPFFGSMGVAPPPVTGRISSNPPSVHGGNLDN